MAKMLVNATNKLEKNANFYYELKYSTAAHCYIEILEKHNLKSLLPKQ
jgi:hypothetical protein